MVNLSLFPDSAGLLSLKLGEILSNQEIYPGADLGGGGQGWIEWLGNPILEKQKIKKIEKD